MDVITIQGLKKRFPKGRFQLDLPELAIQEGYITGFIGENGAGKTTTLKLMMDMLYADEGQITIFGKDAHLDSAAIKKEIGYIGETPGFLEQGRLRSLKRMVQPFYENWDEAVFQRYADRFSLDLNKRYKELSKGKRKQFAVAVALSHHPRLLLLDEPTANLDPLIRQEILEILLDEMQQEGISIFFSTHITSDLDKVADSLVFLHEGRLLLSGYKDEILDGHRMVRGRRELLTPEVAGLLVDVEASEFGFTGLTGQFAAVYALLGDEAVYEKPSVEDIFIGYTRRKGSIRCTVR